MGKKVERRISGLDYAKFIAAFWVIAIHVSPLEEINRYLNYYIVYVIGRIAVPLFFMITGYFILEKALNNVYDLKKYLLHIFKLYLFSIVLYIPINLYKGIGKISVSGFLKALLFEGTMYHLWYFPAVIIGMLIVYLLARKFGIRWCVFICLILYIIGVLGDNYYGLAIKIPFFKFFYEVIYMLFTNTRNGIFFAPIFLLLGYLRKTSPIIDRCIWKKLIISILILTFEGGMVYLFQWQKHNALYFSLPLCGWYLFPLLFKCRKEKTKILNDLSMYIYIIHVWIIVIIFKLFRNTEIGPLGKYIVISIISLVLSIFIIRIKNKGKKLQKNEVI